MRLSLLGSKVRDILADFVQGSARQSALIPLETEHGKRGSEAYRHPDNEKQ
jgi:hypothetical protein